MRLRLTLLSLLLLPVFPALAQLPDAPAAPKSEVSKPSRDFVMLQFTYEGWNNAPDSLDLKSFGRGFNGYLCYDFPIKKSSFSFAAGIGVGTSNIYFNDQQIVLNDTGALAGQVRFVPETVNYKRYKLSTAYLEAPFELRYFGNKENRNKGFKAAIGLRVGTLVGAHTKGIRTVDGSKVAEKVNTRRYLDTWRFGATARVGYGNFTLFGSYNLNSLYKEGSGPQFTPFSVGLCITGL